MSMTTLHDLTLSPDIIVGKEEHRQLTVLALAGTGHSADVADGLLYELERASVLPDELLPQDVVRMGARVRFRQGDGEEREVTLVYPVAADIAQNRISVMTPIGAALIGLRRGQSITWMTRDGRKQVLTVLDVQAPETSGEDDPGPVAA